MQVRTSYIKALFSIVILWCIALFASCSDEMPIDHPYGGLSGEGISFGVSKDVSSWEPDSRALQPTDSIALPCISDDETFGMSVVVKEKAVPLSRGTQFTSADTLKAFDVAAYRYKDNDKNTQLYFSEKVNDGVHTSGKTYYWLYEETMDFLAFAPQDVFTIPTAEAYNQDEVTFNYSIDADEQNHQDIMVASAKGLDYDDAGYPVSLNFKHLLASVRFVVGDMQFIKIESLAIRNVRGGNVDFVYNKQGNAWTNAEPATITTFTPDFVETSGLPKGSEIAGNANNATLFMAPQTLPDDAVIEVTYTELLTGTQKSGTASIGGTAWEAGKDYAYAFNIGTKFDVTIPTPTDQDAHYVMLRMDYDLGELSGIINTVTAKANWVEGYEGNSTVNGISLKFAEDLTNDQRAGYWTDRLYTETITYTSADDYTSSGIQDGGNLRGEESLTITNLSAPDAIVLFLEENNGDKERIGELVFTANINGQPPVTIGKGRFKQLCPSWNDDGVGVERFEDDANSPYGYSYNRMAKYEYTGEYKDDLTGILGRYNGGFCGQFHHFGHYRGWFVHNI